MTRLQVSFRCESFCVVSAPLLSSAAAAALALTSHAYCWELGKSLELAESPRSQAPDTTSSGRSRDAG